VGPNGAGKSTLLCALNIFFRETGAATTDLQSLSIEDFHQKNAEDPVTVTLTFTDLNQEAQDDFKDYFRQGKLVVSAKAVFNPALGRAEVRQYGERLGMDAFKPFFKALGDNASAKDLKELYAQLRAMIPALPNATTKDAMAQALREYEADRPNECQLIPSEDQFYGVSRGSNRLQKYIQWVYVPAVKDATQEQAEAKNTALGKLLARTVRAKVNFEEAVNKLLSETREKYEAILGGNQAALDGISSSLCTRLAQWAHPDAVLKLTWQQDPSKSVRVEEPFAKIIAGEGDFEGELARFGHGFQRSYLLALLQELAGSDDANAPLLLLGCEEPELYQHPPQARHLAGVLADLSKGNAQIVVTTHSPYFIQGEHFEKVRMIRKDPISKSSSVRRLTQQEIADRYAGATGEAAPALSASMAKLVQALQPAINEMFFTQRLVLVEGLEDAAYVMAWLTLTDRLVAFRRAGCHIVSTNGKSEMIKPLIIAQGMEIPVFCVFDCDGDKTGDAGKKQRHERDNRALLRLLGGNEAVPFPAATVWDARYVCWATDIGGAVENDLTASLGGPGFEQVRNQAHAMYGNDGGLKKATMLIASKLALARDAGGQCASLNTLCERILAFGAS